MLVFTGDFVMAESGVPENPRAGHSSAIARSRLSAGSVVAGSGPCGARRDKNGDYISVHASLNSRRGLRGRSLDGSP
jgi:hypothetical protein